MKLQQSMMMCLALPFFAGGLFAEDLVITAVKRPGDSGMISIRVSDGVITAIGEDIDTANAGVISGNGGYVTPGFIDSGSTLGIEEVGLSTNAEDQKYEGMDMGAAFNPSLAFNRDSSIIPSLLVEGVTHVFLKPSPGMDVFAGQGALANLSGKAMVSDPKALYVYLGERGRELAGKSRAAALQRLLLGLKEGEVYDREREAYQANRLRPLSFPMEDLEVLAAVMRREKKLIVYVDRAAEIETVLMSLDSFNIDIVLMGAREAWKVVDAIRDRDIPVILNALDNLPRSFDQLGARLDQPRLLHEAGISFALMTEDLYTETRMLAQAAGVAVAYGLPWQAALDAVTVNPARIWGLDDRLGSLEPGKSATLIIWDGDPLEVTSIATRVLINGELIDLENRQDLLRDRYSTVGEGNAPFVYR